MLFSLVITVNVFTVLSSATDSVSVTETNKLLPEVPTALAVATAEVALTPGVLTTVPVFSTLILISLPEVPTALAVAREFDAALPAETISGVPLVTETTKLLPASPSSTAVAITELALTPAIGSTVLPICLNFTVLNSVSLPFTLPALVT